MDGKMSPRTDVASCTPPKYGTKPEAKFRIHSGTESDCDTGLVNPGYSKCTSSPIDPPQTPPSACQYLPTSARASSGVTTISKAQPYSWAELPGGAAG